MSDKRRMNAIIARGLIGGVGDSRSSGLVLKFWKSTKIDGIGYEGSVSDRLENGLRKFIFYL